MDRDIREGGDNLLLWRQVCALLEFEVADSSAKGQVAIDATEVDEATCGTYTGFLALVLRLVVERQGLCSSLDAED